MGFEMRDSFVRREECKAAWESEVEFAEMARVLKALAAELGQAPVPRWESSLHMALAPPWVFWQERPKDRTWRPIT